MTCPSRWEFHPEVLCRQYDKQASDNLFLKSEEKSTIWAIERMSSVPHSPALTQGSASTCVGTVQHKEASSTHVPLDLEAKHGTPNPFSKLELQTESDMADFCSTELQMFHIKHSDNSWSRLNVTRQVFESLCHKLGIFEAFKDNIAFMGRRFYEFEVAPPRPEWQIIGHCVSSEIEASLEYTFTLRYIEMNDGNDDSRPWSLRQFAVYNKHAPPSKSSWVFVSLPNQVFGAIEEYVESIDIPLSERFLQLHLAFLTFSVRCWRPYLIYLAKEVEQCNGTVTCAAPPSPLRIDLSQLQVRMKNLESQLNDALLASRANSDAASTLMRFLAQQFSHRTSAEGDTSDLEASLNSFRLECNKDYDMIILKLESLRCKLQSCIQMASSFSELMNGHSLSQNGESLRKLAEEQGEEAHHMGMMADKSRRDAIAIKGLSIITLIYLPTTVVLNFFSASFIDISSGRMDLVGKWWLFLVVGLPLTIVTLAAWALWMKYGLPKAEHAHLAHLDEEKGQQIVRADDLDSLG